MKDPVLEIVGLRKSYKGFALRDVSFTLPRGYVMGLVGPNGAGKTTIVKLIMNLVSPEAGAIRLFGLDNREHEAQVKARVGWVYDVPPFYADITLENTKRAVAPFYPEWNEVLFKELVNQFELPLKKKVKTLSQGMKTKFGLALALSHNAELLILDEPTTGLDPVFRRELLQGFSGLLQDEKKSILFSTHITTDLERIADYVTFIRDGEIVLSTNREELAENWGVVRGDEATVALLDPGIRHGIRRNAHGVEVLTSDVRAARRACGDGVVVDPVSFEDMVVLMEGREHNA
jgi:ABC-2 type transport system ATP-binding protein